MTLTQQGSGGQGRPGRMPDLAQGPRSSGPLPAGGPTASLYGKQQVPGTALLSRAQGVRPQCRQESRGRERGLALETPLRRLADRLPSQQGPPAPHSLQLGGRPVHPSWEVKPALPSAPRTLAEPRPSCSPPLPPPSQQPGLCGEGSSDHQAFKERRWLERQKWKGAGAEKKEKEKSGSQRDNVGH